PAEVGLIISSALLVSGILGPLVGGPLADICQRRGGPRLTMRVMGLLSLASAPTALFAILADSLTAGLTLTVFLTFGYVIGVATSTLALVVVPPDLRGLYLSVTVTVA